MSDSMELTFYIAEQLPARQALTRARAKKVFLALQEQFHDCTLKSLTLDFENVELVSFSFLHELVIRLTGDDRLDLAKVIFILPTQRNVDKLSKVIATCLRLYAKSETQADATHRQVNNFRPYYQIVGEEKSHPVKATTLLSVPKAEHVEDKNILRAP